MTPVRRSSTLALGLLAAGCNYNAAKNVDLTQTAPPEPPPVRAAAAAKSPPSVPSVEGAYQLTAASTAIPLPGGATAFVFVGADGALRVGKDSAYLDARFVPSVAAAIEALGHPPPAQTGAGRYHALAERSDLGGVHVVVVMDRAAPAALAVRIADSLPEPIALAVDGGGLPFTLARGPARDGVPAVALSTEPSSHLVAQLDAAALRGGAVVDLQAEIAADDTPELSAAGLTILIDQPRTKVDGGFDGGRRGLDAAIIRQHLHVKTTAIRGCAEKHLLGDAKGTVTAAFVISAEGKVLDLKVTGPTGFDAATTCIARLLGPLEYPRPKGGARVEVTVPITFGRSR